MFVNFVIFVAYNFVFFVADQKRKVLPIWVWIAVPC